MTRLAKKAPTKKKKKKKKKKQKKKKKKGTAWDYGTMRSELELMAFCCLKYPTPKAE